MTTRDTALLELVRAYFATIDRHDTGACTRRAPTGLPMPANNHEQRACMANASAAYRQLVDKATRLGIASRDIIAAISDYQRSGQRLRDFKAAA